MSESGRAEGARIGDGPGEGAIWGPPPLVWPGNDPSPPTSERISLPTDLVKAGLKETKAGPCAKAAEAPWTGPPSMSTEGGGSTGIGKRAVHGILRATRSATGNSFEEVTGLSSGQ
jgi:hypothetical protein